MYYVLNLASYYLYSGDAATSCAPSTRSMKRQLAYNRALVDPSRAC